MRKEWDLRQRTMQFAVATFKFCRTVRTTEESRDIKRQLRRAASSVAANCRALRRSQSDAVFATKAAIVVEEADEAGFWLDFLVQVDLVARQAVADLCREANELVAIFTASRKTVCDRIAAAKVKRPKKCRHEFNGHSS